MDQQPPDNQNPSPSEPPGIPPSPHKEWYSRGYLPHYDHPGLLQGITYHLADSLPASALQRMEEELRILDPKHKDIERCKRLESLLDAGHGNCILRHPLAASTILENWRYFAGQRYDLIAWVIMPNHIHALIRAYEGIPLAKIVHSWKRHTSRHIRLLLPNEAN